MLLPRLPLLFSLLLLGAARLTRMPRLETLGAVGTVLGQSLAAAGASLGFGHFVSPDETIRFDYPSDFRVSEKPLKTHVYEAYLKSDSRKGYNEGITVG